MSLARACISFNQTSSNASSIRKRAVSLLIACSILTVSLLASSATHAVECSNGGLGPNPAGNDGNNPDRTACGNGAQATGSESTAIGSNASGSGPESVAVGDSSSASGFGAIATGASTIASGQNAIALGNQTRALNDGSIAIGANVFSQATNAIAIGNGAQATGTNSVAIGSGSVASAPNTVSFGSTGNERRLTNVAAGIAPTDAVNVSQLNSFASGWTAGLQNQINTNQTEARAGIALALASSALQYDPRPGKLSVAAAVSNFRGQSALASGLGYAINSQWRVNASFTATPQVNQYGAAIGSSWTLN